MDDMNAARDELLSRGVEVSEVFHDAANGWLLEETTERLPGRV